ncbi:TPA: hypothetical protein DIV49_03870 [Candidatus Saccharibacteria bacterium]|nr:hypothetical protein [Candidatus Saccharibacteria bacterium]HRJ91022.1 hypothetical protein [Candidatus Saccharibacteria bacterium]
MEENNSNSIKFVVLMVAAVLLIVVGGLAWMVFGQKDSDADDAGSSSTTSKTSTSDTDTESVVAAESVEIIFTDDGFEKSVYGVKSGGEVTVKNNSSGDLQFSSDDHPTHLDDTELNLDVLAAGESTTFSPETTGTWGVHDHLHDQFTTTLVVK